MDLLNIVIRTQKREIFLDIQPLVRRSTYCPVVKVESVNVDDSISAWAWGFAAKN